LNREITGNFLEKTFYKRGKSVINQHDMSNLCGPVTGNFLRLNWEFFTPNWEFTGNASRRVGERRRGDRCTRVSCPKSSSIPLIARA
jgi:hypothetical protein